MPLTFVNCPISVGMVPESWFNAVVARITENMTMDDNGVVGGW
jgi:hypothetical protein